MEAPIEMMNIKSTDTCLKNRIERSAPEYLFGRQMRDYRTNSIFEDWCRWNFPNGTKSKIEDNQLYLVWYETRDASDPMNSSETNYVYYIEKAPKEIQATYEGLIYAKEKLAAYKNERRRELTA